MDLPRQPYLYYATRWSLLKKHWSFFIKTSINSLGWWISLYQIEDHNLCPRYSKHWNRYWELHLAWVQPFILKWMARWNEQTRPWKHIFVYFAEPIQGCGPSLSLILSLFTTSDLMSPWKYPLSRYYMDISHGHFHWHSNHQTSLLQTPLLNDNRPYNWKPWGCMNLPSKICLDEGKESGLPLKSTRRYGWKQQI